MNAKNWKVERFGYFVKYWVPVFVLLGVIFWLSGANFTDGKTSEFFFPKIKSVFPGLSPDGVAFVHELIRAFAHIFEFFVLGLLLSLAINRLHLRISGFQKGVLIFVLLCLFALGDEVRQSLVDLRHASLVDVGLDLVGGVMGMMVGGRRAEVGGRRTEVGGQRSEDGDRRSENGGQRAEIGGLRTVVRGRKAEVGGLRTEEGDADKFS